MKLVITVDGHTYEVEVEVADDTPEGPSYYPPVHARTPATPNHGPPPARREEKPAGDGRVCRSPLAGTVSVIKAKEGQEIEANEVLLVLEAMKMETEVTAPFAGVVKSVNASVGEAVKQGQVLVEFE